MRFSATVGVLLTTGALVMLTTPANASAGMNIADASGVRGNCAYVTTLPGGTFNTLKVVLSYTVIAKGAAYATNGICEVRDHGGGTGSRAYGSVSAFGVGPVAEGAGTVDVPRDIVDPVVCNTPQALYTDGTSGNPTNAKTCSPL